MPQVTQQQIFNPDNIQQPVVGLAIDHGQHDSGEHQHNKAQLLYAEQGCMTITLTNSICIIPPTKAVWIPSKVKHRVVMAGHTHYRSLYFNMNQFHHLPKQLKILAVNPLLQALICRISFWPIDNPYTLTDERLALVLIDELNNAQALSLYLSIPTSKRLKKIVADYKENPSCQNSLTTYAKNCGASTKTLTRLFQKETGMSFIEWKQQARLVHAIKALSELRTVSEVSDFLGFSCNSAFIQFFKNRTGNTPKQYMRNHTHFKL